MEETDKLCQLLFKWSKKRKSAAERLLALAEKLEELHSNINTAKLVGNATSVAGIVGAGIATLCTAGLATPLLVAAGAGAVVTIGSSLAEVGISRSDLKDAQSVIKEDKEMGETIERLLKQLYEKCARQTPTSQASSASSNDAVEWEVMTQLMGQMARHYKIEMPPEILRNFNRSTMYHQSVPGSLDPATALNFVGLSFTTTATVALATTVGAVMTQGLKVSAKESFRFGAKEVGKDIGFIGIRTVITGGLKVAGFAVGLGLSLYDLIDNIEKMVKDNHATEASRALRNAAGEIQKSSRDLQDKLDALREIIIKLSQLKEIIKNLGGYSFSVTPNERDLLNYIIATCEDEEMANWLEQDENQIVLLNLLRFSLRYLRRILEDRSPRHHIGHVHIIFVAHGGITYDFFPTSSLVPTPTIHDTVLYSPWKCAVDAYVVSGIALGSIMPDQRRFVGGQPNVLPPDWNYMRRSPYPLVPRITVHPVTRSENAWKAFKALYNANGLCPAEDRIIIPYLQEHKALPGVPFYAFVFAISWIVMLWRKTATIHLGACLNQSPDFELSPQFAEQLAAQYAYTANGVKMTTDMNVREIEAGLYRAFKSMFG